MKTINVMKLHKELVAAGVEISGCNSDGKVWDKDNIEIQDRADMQAIILAHDPKLDITISRREEYNKAGASSQEMIYALWKKIMQNDPADADALQTLINDVDSTLA